MTDWLDINTDHRHIAREKQKAKNMRNSQWWQNKVAAGICYYCHGKFPPAELTMDHLVPLARGGKSNRGNIVPCCKECNNKKKYLTPVDIILAQIKEENSAAGDR